VHRAEAARLWRADWAAWLKENIEEVADEASSIVL
jgi:hypothetical protein